MAIILRSPQHYYRVHSMVAMSSEAAYCFLVLDAWTGSGFMACLGQVWGFSCPLMQETPSSPECHDTRLWGSEPRLPCMVPGSRQLRGPMNFSAALML